MELPDRTFSWFLRHSNQSWGEIISIKGLCKRPHISSLVLDSSSCFELNSSSSKGKICIIYLLIYLSLCSSFTTYLQINTCSTLLLPHGGATVQCVVEWALRCSSLVMILQLLLTTLSIASSSSPYKWTSQLYRRRYIVLLLMTNVLIVCHFG